MSCVLTLTFVSVLIELSHYRYSFLFFFFVDMVIFDWVPNIMNFILQVLYMVLTCTIGGGILAK